MKQWNEEGRYKSKMQLNDISLFSFICFVNLKLGLEKNWIGGKIIQNKSDKNFIFISKLGSLGAVT